MRKPTYDVVVSCGHPDAVEIGTFFGTCLQVLSCTADRTWVTQWQFNLNAPAGQRLVREGGVTFGCGRSLA